MKTGKSILRIISIGLCAILLVGSVPSASRAEVVERAVEAAALPQIGQAGSDTVAEGAGIAAESERDRAGADQAQALQQMRAGADDDEKKPAYYWTAFYIIGTAVLLMVLMGSI